MKTNYQLILEETLKNLQDKPTILIHSCCGPCSSYVLDYLEKYFDITIVYYNPNIYPETEYQKRLSEQKRIIKEMFNDRIKILNCNYDSEEFEKISKGLESCPEGGIRCTKCFNLRLEKTARLAKQNNFDYFTTTLSVSPYKNSIILNDIGKQLEKKYNIKYLYADFKKKDGYKKSIEYSKKYNLYRQEYCGCKYSLEKNKNVI